jgi:hypothetical protein
MTDDTRLAPPAPVPGEEFAYFDRFDIAEAHYCFAADYHAGQNGPLYAELSRILDPARIGLRPSPSLSTDNLEDNGAAIYRNLRAARRFLAALLAPVKVSA